MIFQTRAKVIKNIEVAPNYYKISLVCLRVTRSAKPGQFIQIKISDDYEPFLRRPFSIHSTKGPRLEVLYEVVGKGTQILAQKKPGEYLDIIGPLGNGFSILNTQYSILVAGGMGIAPLIFLAEKLIKHRTHNLKPRILVLIGAKTKSQILREKEFKELGCEVKISTDDGTKGFKGKVTDLLKDLLSTHPLRKSSISNGSGYSLLSPLGNLRFLTGLATIYACGPRLMLREIAKLSKKYKISAQVSLEEHMACGVGVCLGCVVKTRTENRVPRTEFEYRRVCKEGPVFNAEEIIW